MNNTTFVPDFLFGQNLEHTRSCIFGGLSAQLLRNRKFAGKPSRDGVAADWYGSGAEGIHYDLLQTGYTHHERRNGMFKQNEVNSQFILNMTDRYDGIYQSPMRYRKDKNSVLKVVARCVNDDSCGLRLQLQTASGEEYTYDTVIKGTDWQQVTAECALSLAQDYTFAIQIEPGHSAVIGVTSLMTKDTFHGMRRDVVEQLRAIGTGIIRWPGGNFAGEYRWRDGLLPVDERSPLQAYMEIETQTYTHGYDNHEINVDDVIALCREIGAEPFFTINAVWDSPEESAAFVEYCNGDATTPMGSLRAERGHREPYHVRLWSLGNEMGYAHMEGPHTPAGYAELAHRHAHAMLQVDSSLTLVSSGLYPRPEWVREAAVPLGDVATACSLHQYLNPGIFDMTSPKRTEDTVRRITGLPEAVFTCAKSFRDLIPENYRISFDEWNLWYSWYRDCGTAGGMFALRVMHGFMRHWDDWRIYLLCYFQAVNEGAILVPQDGSPARLTAIGQALSLAAGHRGRTRLELDGLPPESFVSRGDKGELYVTLANADMDNELTWSLPADTVPQNAMCLTAKSYLPGSVFESTPLVCSNGRIVLPPFSMACFVLPPNAL